MNMRQEKFVREYVQCGVAAKAARQQGCELLTNPNVMGAIEALKKELAAAGQVTREEWIQGLVHLARVGETNQVRLQALREIGKAFGWYGPERCEHAVSGGVTFLLPEAIDEHS